MRDPLLSRLALESRIAACPNSDTLLAVRPVVFHASARKTIQAFPKEVRDRLGKALFLLQMGEQLAFPLSRPMPSVAQAQQRLKEMQDES